jgi:hypothetical protein
LIPCIRVLDGYIVQNPVRCSYIDEAPGGHPPSSDAPRRLARQAAASHAAAFSFRRSWSLRSVVLEFEPHDWEFEPGGPDVAVMPLGLQQLEESIASVQTEPFVRPQHRLTVGDDVFMLGLFVDHAGISTNNPAARFGNISMQSRSPRR